MLRIVVVFVFFLAGLLVCCSLPVVTVACDPLASTCEEYGFLLLLAPFCLCMTGQLRGPMVPKEHYELLQQWQGCDPSPITAYVHVLIHGYHCFSK